MRRSTLIGSGIILGACALLVVGVAAKPGNDTKTTVAPLVGHQAPDFSLRTAHGGTVTLSKLRSHAVLVNFWATWCIPCRTEMPLISAVYEAHRAALRVVAVDLQEPASDVNSFARDYHLRFVPVLDSSGSVWDLYHLSTNGPKPVTFWIDRGGVIRAIDYGEMTRRDLTDGTQKVGI